MKIKVPEKLLFFVRSHLCKHSLKIKNACRGWQCSCQKSLIQPVKISLTIKSNLYGLWVRNQLVSPEIRNCYVQNNDIGNFVRNQCVALCLYTVIIAVIANVVSDPRETLLCTRFCTVPVISSFVRQIDRVLIARCFTSSMETNNELRLR